MDKDDLNAKLDSWISDEKNKAIELTASIESLKNEYIYLDSELPEIYAEDEVNEPRKEVFKFFGYTKKVFNFNSDGLVPFLKVERKCENGSFYRRTHENFPKGSYQTTYESDFNKTGIASVKVYAKKKDLLENQARMKQIKLDIRNKGDELVKINQKIKQLEKDKTELTNIINRKKLGKLNAQDEKALASFFQRVEKEFKIERIKIQNEYDCNLAELKLKRSNLSMYDKENIYCLGAMLSEMKLTNPSVKDFLKDFKSCCNAKLLDNPFALESEQKSNLPKHFQEAVKSPEEPTKIIKNNPSTPLSTSNTANNTANFNQSPSFHLDSLEPSKSGSVSLPQTMSAPINTLNTQFNPPVQMEIRRQYIKELEEAKQYYAEGKAAFYQKNTTNAIKFFQLAKDKYKDALAVPEIDQKDKAKIESRLPKFKNPDGKYSPMKLTK